ncbi:sugar ABC transporter substrate-binding protein [Agromyces aerolatus]|uniref:sugar ABC transporter substrate-binding protein n=1 Tax=Agromyces sp. LY-1074 TaxID=3074080 RepID=UPI00285E93B3|nr:MULTISPECIES: sugar ABC transporter substrate-binding protein [unclassified Agromyces]MDR5701134.1 sugar ABC transporter substrate-binding protein [Agromyces sp. LY-1074]MDR5707774.1 sugar ABC transporter substrate-binding protein [Agromyces sp. LY-1358]
MRRKHLAIPALAIAAGVAFAGCSGPAESEPTEGDDALSIGFFGFAAANSFAQGVYDGVEAAAEEYGASVEFVDPNFDGQLQAQQITDAVTSGQFDIIIIQANDNLVVQAPLEQAIAAGITVVVEFTAVGPDFETAEPQIDGAISIVDPAVINGEKLGEMGLLACEEAGADPCQVGYMEGFRALPLDNARTQAVVETLTAGGAEVVAQVEGGYTADSGQAAFQDIITANPDVNVVIGSSQAVGGARLAAGADSPVLFVGNGSSRQAVEAVRSGDWFATYALDLYLNGFTAAELGIKQHNGEDVEVAISQADLTSFGAIGTAENLEGFEATYDD